MEMSKIVFFFVVLGLAATSSADKCDVDEAIQNLEACATSFTYSVLAAGNDKEIECSGLRTFQSCIADATIGCDSAITSRVNPLRERVNFFENKCVRLGYSNASSTSVVNIALLIAAVATLVSFV